jgi:malate dehydrogenase
VVIAPGGVERIIEIDLHRNERGMFEKSVEAVRSLCEACTKIQPALA